MKEKKAERKKRNGREGRSELSGEHHDQPQEDRGMERSPVHINRKKKKINNDKKRKKKKYVSG